MEPGTRKRDDIAASPSAREQYDSLLEQLPVPLLLWQRQGDDFILSGRNRAARDIGIARLAALLGSDVSTGSVLAPGSSLVSHLQRCLDTQQRVETQLVHPGPEQAVAQAVRAVLIPLSPEAAAVTLEDPGGSPEAGAASGDEAMYRLLFENAVVGIFQSTPDGRFLRVNRSFAAMLGYESPAELVRSISDIASQYYVNPEDRIRYQAALKQDGIVRDFEFAARRKDGSEIIVSNSTHAYFNERGEVDYYEGTLVDISERRQVEEELARIFAMSLDLICVADIKSATFLKVNPAVTDILGYRETELPGKSFFELMHPDDIERTRSVVQERLMQGARVVDFVNRYRCSDGSYKWLSWVSHPDEEREKTYAVARDITAWKEAEAKLATHQALLDATGRMARVGGWELDAATLKVTWTDEVYRIHELPLNHMPDLDEAINFFHPDDRPRLEEGIRRALEEGTGYDMELRFTTAAGTELWTRTKCEPELAGGRVVKLRGTFQDITERKRAEAVLESQNRLMTTLLENLQVGVFMAEAPSGRPLLANKKAIELLGKGIENDADTSTLAEVYQAFKKGTDTLYPHDEMPIVRGLQGESHSIDDMEVLKPDGSRVRLQVHGSPVRDQGGEVIGSLVSFVDITGQKRAEREHELLQRQLLQSQKMESVGRLAGGVAHDFNNMLSVILGYAELAMERVGEQHELQAELEQIHAAGKRAMDVTRQLLAFARKQNIAPKTLVLNDTVGSMLSMLQRLIGEDIKLRWQPGPNIWPVRLDPSQVDQVLANLCVNAKDAAGPGGTITIETDNAVLDGDYCQRHGGAAAGDYVMLSVSDDGCGMDAVTLSKIFEPFFTTKGVHQGTGLGLATVYGIIKQNRGIIDVASEPGQGTTFKLYLPRHKQAREAEAASQAEAIPRGGGEVVLLVEDEPAVLHLGRKMLDKLGYRVVTAHSPTEALERAAAEGQRIDIVLTDVVMPEMNGRELAAALEKTQPGVKVLYMSGYTADVIARQGILDEGVDFIQKPFSLRELGAKINDALSGRKT